jgi:hypothetical protein
MNLEGCTAMSVRICNEPLAGSPDKDFVRVEACPDPLDDTATLVTIERIVEMPPRATLREPTRRVKTLVTGSRMPADIALGLATRYAERKRIPVVYANGLKPAGGLRTVSLRGNADQYTATASQEHDSQERDNSSGDR